MEDMILWTNLSISVLLFYFSIQTYIKELFYDNIQTWHLQQEQTFGLQGWHFTTLQLVFFLSDHLGAEKIEILCKL